MNVGLSSLVTAIRMTILKCSPTMPDYDDEEDVMSDSLGLLHVQCLEKRCSHLPREGCASSPNQSAFAKVKPPLSQAARTDECLQSRTPERPTGWERREEATETVNSHRVWEELHSQNE